MGITIDRFVEKYTAAIQEGHAALFAGAGLSAPSGFVNWQELLRPFANDISLSIEREHDYLAVAQYYYNEKGQNRSAFSNEILRRFSESSKENAAVEIVTRLPIRTYWTTNYDALIENGLKHNNRRPDIKRRIEDLALNQYDSDAVVYKMHGDITDPTNIVLLKDDYEMYEKDRGLFTTVLSGDLASKTFLFIGFSFEDPNLSAIMGRIKSILGNNVREHYCLFQKVIRHQNEAEEDFRYREQKQMLMMHDLNRYGIYTVLLDFYSDIPTILSAIENRVRKKNIFISGSMSVDTPEWSLQLADQFASEVAEELTSMDCRITSGYGLGIGSAVITGVLKGIQSKKYAHMDEYLRLYPFPQPLDGEDFRKLWSNYREQMLNDCGVAVFMFGNKKDCDGNVVNAGGMIQEFEIAQRNGARIIPLASTGCTAREIYDKMRSNEVDYPYLEKYWDILLSEKSSKRLAEIISAISKEG